MVIRPVIPQAIELIKQTEGLVVGPDGLCHPYEGRADAKGVLTIGYGHVIQPHERHLLAGITQQQAENLLANDVAKHAQYIQADVGDNVEIDDWLYGALASFCFNLGARILKSQRCSISALLRKNKRTDAIFRMSLYCRSDNIYRDGLFYRRLTEMWLALAHELISKPISCKEAKKLIAQMVQYGPPQADTLFRFFSNNHRQDLCVICKRK